MEYNKCIICGGSLENNTYKGLVKCNKCGFITTNLDITESELEELYSSKYFNGEEYNDYLSDKKLIQKNFNNRLKKIYENVPKSDEKKLFEIGCAYGLFLDIAKENFKHVEGIDISKDAAKYARETLKLDATAGDYLSYNIEEKVDVICMWDTIEHLKSPHLFIEKASSHLNNNGIIAITTGDIGSFNAKFRKEKWRQIHPPTHMHYFSKNTLETLLRKNGFELLSCTYPSSYMSVKNIAYIILTLRTKNKKLYNYLDKAGLLNWYIRINMFDLMYIIARKVK